MLDIDRQNLNEVANAVVEEMVITGQIKAEDQGNVLKVLLSKHKWDKILDLAKTCFVFGRETLCVDAFALLFCTS